MHRTQGLRQEIKVVDWTLHNAPQIYRFSNENKKKKHKKNTERERVGGAESTSLFKGSAVSVQ